MVASLVLKNTKGSIKNSVRFEGLQVPLEVLLANRFAQVRGKEADYEGIPELAEHIAEAGGLYNPLTIALFTRRQLTGWDKLVSSMYDGRRSLRSCRVYGDLYPVPVAGRRRLAAIAYLQHHGAQAWQGYDESLSECFDYLFPDGLIETRVRRNISPEGTMEIQLAENLSQRRPHASKEAQAMNDLWIMCKRTNPRLTRKVFVRRLTVSVHQLRVAIWMEQLPDSVRKDIYKGAIRWSNGALLGKFFSALLGYKTLEGKHRTREEAETAFFKHVGTAKVLKANDFADYLAPFFKEVYGQQNLFAGQAEFELVPETYQPVVISRAVETAGLDALTLINRVSEGIKRGDLLKPKDHSGQVVPLQTKATRIAVGALNYSTQTLCDLMHTALPAHEYAALAARLQGSQVMLDAVEQVAEAGSNQTIQLFG